jgi:glycogen debranching enzyme
MFAEVLRHGLIPNLLDSGRRPRYNARDASWWFVKSVFDYIEFTGEKDILNQEVNLRFTSDDYDTHQDNVKKGILK